VIGVLDIVEDFRPQWIDEISRIASSDEAYWSDHDNVKEIADVDAKVSVLMVLLAVEILGKLWGRMRSELEGASDIHPRVLEKQTT